MNKKGKTLLTLVSFGALSMHIINRIEFTRSVSKDILSNHQNKYYEWRFGKIRYHKKGSGIPLLMIHDLTPGSSSYEFHKLTDILAENNEVYCIDLLGYGLSDKPNITYTNYLFVQLVSDFIKNVIGRKTNIAASGDSVPIAVMACHNDNEFIHKLIVLNPQNLFQLALIPTKKTKLLKFLIETPVLGTFLYHIYTNKAAFTTVFQDKYFYNPYNISENYIHAYIEAAHTPNHCSKYSYASYIGRYMNANIIHALKEVNNSIYIISGEEIKGNHTVIDNYRYYNQAIEAIYLPRTRQIPHLEKPEEVLNYFKIFLEHV